MQGAYINLQESTGRRAAMQAHLATLGLESHYPRFDALRGTDAPERLQSPLSHGHLGCWLSHRALWERAARLPDDDALHILEDDARLHASCRPLLLDLVARQPDWDLVFTDVFWHPPPNPTQWVPLRNAVNTYRNRREFTVMPLRGWRFTGLTSYVVRPRGARRLLEHLQGRWSEGRTVDVLIDELVQQSSVRGLVVLPFVSTLSAESDQSTTGDQGPALRSITGFRRALYCEADVHAIRRQVLRAGADGETEPLLDVYLAMLRDVLRTVKE